MSLACSFATVNASSATYHSRRHLISATFRGFFPPFLALPALPQPPQPEPALRFDTATIALIIVVVLGIVSLLALAMRPLVAQWLGGEAPGPIREPGDQHARNHRDRVSLQIPAEPQQAARPATPAIRPDTIAAIAEIIRQLLAAANTGDYRAGLALYTTAFRQRSAAQSGLTEAQFEAALATAPPPSPSEWLELDAIDAVELLPGGRIAAVAHYRKAEGPPPSPERYVFVQDRSGRWLIDDIRPADG